MSVIIGSARIDEHGNAHGGAAGDQKQTSAPDYKGEVSMQSFYVHSKGWLIFRAKDEDQALHLAKAMRRACNNPNIGYDQDQRDGVVIHGTATKVKTECDCSSLVRRCIIEATGRDPGNIRTISMPVMLAKTGLFEPAITYKDGVKVCTGDILVTKTKGHTVIVVKGASRGGGKEVAEPTLRRGDKGTEVSILQKNLNAVKQSGKDGKKLTVDGDFGPNTEYAVRLFQKAKGLSADGIYGPKTYAALKKAL
jgi:hypothetical protein